jgi:hypothetical protein
MLNVSAVPAGLTAFGRKLYSALATAVAAGLPETVVAMLMLPLVLPVALAVSLAVSALPEPPQPARTAVMVSDTSDWLSNPHFLSAFMINRLANR